MMSNDNLLSSMQSDYYPKLISMRMSKELRSNYMLESVCNSEIIFKPCLCTF